MEIPTAEEQLIKLVKTRSHKGKLECITEFAKLHVKKALEQAKEQVRFNNRGDDDYDYDFTTINKDSILNAYPLDLIK